MPKTTSIRLEEETLARLDRLARAIDRPRSWVVGQAIERFLDYEEWFAKAVEKGIAEADRGALVTHDQAAAAALEAVGRTPRRRR